MSERPVVLLYRNKILPYSETFIRDQALSFTRWKPVLVGQERVDGLDLEALEVQTLLPPGQGVRGRLARRLNRISGGMDGQALARIRSLSPSLVHAHFGTNALDADRLARQLGLPLLVSLHGYDITTWPDAWKAGQGGKRLRRYPRQLRALGRQDHVSFLAVSRAIRDKAIEFGLPAEKIHVRYTGIRTDRFEPGGSPVPQRDPEILFIGRLVEKKNCAQLIRVTSALAEEIPGLHLRVIGDGPQEPDLRALADRLGTRVSFLGRRAPEEVAEALSRARVFCLPSVRARNGDAEGFGMVLLEAQAAGVPVVSSALGGTQEGLIDGETGFSFPEHDDIALAEALRGILSDDALAGRMSRNGPGFVRENFDIQRCGARIEDLYDGLTGRNGETA